MLIHAPISMFQRGIPEKNDDVKGFENSTEASASNGIFVHVYNVFCWLIDNNRTLTNSWFTTPGLFLPTYVHIYVVHISIEEKHQFR